MTKGLTGLASHNSNTGYSIDLSFDNDMYWSILGFVLIVLVVWAKFPFMCWYLVFVRWCEQYDNIDHHYHFNIHDEYNTRFCQLCQFVQEAVLSLYCKELTKSVTNAYTACNWALLWVMELLSSFLCVVLLEVDFASSSSRNLQAFGSVVVLGSWITQALYHLHQW